MLDELTSEKASVRLKIEVANGGITDSIIGNEPCGTVPRPVPFAPRKTSHDRVANNIAE